MPQSALSGRRAQAARNNKVILDSARAVFIAEPDAPITAVARHAGVGISALYSRYGSKEELLRKLCSDGLERLVAETEAALADDRDDWTVLTSLMTRLVDADTSSLTAARSPPSPPRRMLKLVEPANPLLSDLFNRVSGALRPGAAVHDLSVIFEMVAAVKNPDPERTRELRRRYLAVIVDGLRAGARDPLPGAAPTWTEVASRWAPRT